ncbi:MULTISPECIES: ATP-dependent nuclease [Morganellaceae]|uniref:ATP-dependent nuclease n=1 Tax=Morganellaceae TaxID=1903414 RepID=UPI00189C81DF|nr:MULTISPECIES: AAA family ATPase [Morganellaceae]EKW4026337.1 AAA family ATPase [Proteus mirabilis]EKW4660652.1 AAA family ATPase [Proteus mirabilis]ELB1684573.1 AAA family ATPase [Proteus mirabilis]HDU8343364.1 AAA family ATPase [Proteus mirabilis]
MEISKVDLVGFRCFKDVSINFRSDTLLIGANDVGKSNLLHALRILLDRSLSEVDIEPTETDFYTSKVDSCSEIIITVHFKDVIEDAVLSVLKGAVSNDGKSIFRYKARLDDLSYQLFVGHNIEYLEEVTSRFYLRYVNLNYMESQRDLQKYIAKEKRKLLKTSFSSLSEQQLEEDKDLLDEIGRDLLDLNDKVSQLVYVDQATSEVNTELKKLSNQHRNYVVQLDTGAIQVSDFVDKLKLGASMDGSSVMLGGDGRNNQILLALWKAKSVREHSLDHEVVFYVIEEPEAHLHPHQQGRMANYLINELPGQTIISTHSPRIAANFKPDSIIRLLGKNNSTIAASGGCSDCIEQGFEDMSYRISIIPAEAFFSNGVLLVEGPSEELFYHALAQSLEIDLDFLNLSILCVNGVSFKVYVAILNALEIPWVMRTDNDVSKVPSKILWQYAGMNRCLALCGDTPEEHSETEVSARDTLDNGKWDKITKRIEQHNIFLSRVDLETDLVEELSNEVLKILGKTTQESAIKHLQSKKALHMRELLKNISDDLPVISDGQLAKPLHTLIRLVMGD